MIPKIIIAEDDKVSAALLHRATEAMGYSAILCSSGRRAWEVLNDNVDVAILITDVMMPDMSGSELIGIIRGNQAFANLPIIVISGVAKPSEIDSLLKLGASRFLPKPIDLTELKHYLQALVRPKQ